MFLLSFKAVYTLLQAALISFSISWISQPSWHGYQENNGIKVACGGSCFWTFQNAITFKYFRFPLEVRTSAASVYWNGQNQAEMLGFAGLEFWYQVNLDIYRISDLNFVKIGLCCQRLRETHIRVVKHATSQSKTCWSLLFTGTWRVSIKHVKCI